MRAFLGGHTSTGQTLTRERERESKKKGRPEPTLRFGYLDIRLQFSVKAMIELPRLASIWVLPPAPTTTNCLPPTS